MSKLDIRNAIRESGINCEFEGQLGKVLLITQDMLNRFPASEDSKSPDVVAGEAIVTYQDADTGTVRGQVILPGARNDLNLMIRDKDGEENRIYVGDILSLPNAVREANRIKDNVGIKQATALDNLKSYADFAFKRVLDKPRLAAPEHISAALSFQLEDSRQNEREETRLSAEQMDLITTARGLRETIGRIDPNHPDALVGAETYASRGYANYVIDELEVRSVDLTPQMRAALRADHALSTEVFGAMTSTPIHALSAQMIDPRSFEAVRQKLRPGQVRNGYVDVIEQRLKDIFAERMPSYNGMHEIELYTKNGADVLLVRDHVGAYVYGWDSDSRQLEIADNMAFSEADVPDEAEIERLREVLADVRYEIGGDPVFDLFDEEPGKEVDADELNLDDLFADNTENDDDVDFNY